MPLCKVPTCWTERTYLEKVLIVSLIFAIAFALAVSSAYLAAVLIENEKLKENETKASENDHVCMTESCISTAASILDNMDPKIAPCEDFYNFACGNFLKKTIIPEDQKRVYYILSTVKDSLQKQLKLMLEEPIQTNELKPFQMIKKIFKTCTNEDLIEKDGLNTIQSIIKDLGGWPVLEGDKWAESRFNWTQLIYRFREIGFFDVSLLKIFVRRDMHNSDRRVLNIYNPPFDRTHSLHKRAWTDEEVKKAYFRFMVDTAVQFGADRNRSESELRDAFIFDRKISDLSNQTSNVIFAINASYLQQAFPNFTWMEFINKILAPYYIKSDEKLYVNLKYLKSLEPLLQTVSKRTLANYMIWRFIYYCTPFLNKALREARLRYERVFTGVPSISVRWKHCLNNFIDVDGNDPIQPDSLFVAVGALYVRKYFSKKEKADAQEMVSNIYRSFQDTLEHIDWMDAKTRKNALDKAKAMIMNTAYPDEFLDDQKLLLFYGDFELNENNYLKSIFKLNLFDIRNHFKSLREPAYRTDWIEIGRVLKANAYYNMYTNSIHVPFGILQKQTFSTQRPNYLNYGVIGTIIGHEITHGFDNGGRFFDKNGNYLKWWTNKSSNSFDNKATCIVKQYSKYKLPELNMTVNGTFTLGENIADNGGFEISYKAYKKWVEKNGTEKTLPGLKYTPNQLFWISVASFWCSKSRPELLQKSLKDDPHSPNRFRVIGPLSNYKDFADDFHCSVGSKMNPKQKCKFW